MQSLQHALDQHVITLAETENDHSMEAKERFDASLMDVHAAARYHTKGSHITVSFLDGSSGRKEVVWDAEEQRFTDWGNNYWLHGPKSYTGERAGGKWVLRARHDNDVIVAAFLDRANMAAKTIDDSSYVAQLMWRYYWELLLLDRRFIEGTTVDLHLQPLDVNSLAAKSESQVRTEEPTKGSSIFHHQV